MLRHCTASMALPGLWTRCRSKRGDGPQEAEQHDREQAAKSLSPAPPWQGEDMEHDPPAPPLPYLRLRKSEDPQHCSSPLAMIAMRSPSRSASSMKWVVSRMVRLLLCCCRRSHVALREAGSIPDVGSSSITTYTQEMGAGHKGLGEAQQCTRGQRQGPEGALTSQHVCDDLAWGAAIRQQSCTAALGHCPQSCPPLWGCSCPFLDVPASPTGSTSESPEGPASAPGEKGSR